MSGLQQLASSSTDVTFIPEMSLNPASSTWYQPSTGDNGITNSGVKAEYFSNTNLSGDPVLTRVEPGVNLIRLQPGGRGVLGAVHLDHQANRFRCAGVQGAGRWPLQTVG